MNSERIIAVLHLHSRGELIDIDIPLDITANELIIGLNLGFNLGMDTSNLSECYLKTENPIALVKGNKTLADFELRNGTVINYM